MVLYKTYIKRFLDIISSLAGLLLLLPLLITIIILIRATSKGPSVFKQKRVGKNKKYFYIYKFRTMCTDTPGNCPTHLLENPQKYITPVGRFLRLTSLDELPQLVNILIGDMSVVGPRPALWNQDDLIAERDKCGANELRPGLTGWAQINGRDVIETSEKAKFDGEYTEKLSFLFDCRCFFGTFASVLKREGFAEGCNKVPIQEQEPEKEKVAK